MLKPGKMTGYHEMRFFVFNQLGFIAPVFTLFLLVLGIGASVFLVQNGAQFFSLADENSILGSPPRTSCEKDLSQGNFLTIDTNGCGELTNIPERCSEEGAEGHQIKFTAPINKDGQWVTVKSDGSEINEDQIRQKLRKEPRMGPEAGREAEINSTIQPELINCNLFINYSDDTDCDVEEPVFERNGKVMERMLEGESYTITLRRGANDRNKPRDQRAGVGCRVEMKVAANNSSFARQEAKGPTMFKQGGKGGGGGQVIAIDPGHCSNDKYGEKKTAENKINIAQANALAKYLNANGYVAKVFNPAGDGSCSEEDYYMNLQARVDFANNNNASLFVSIHQDSSEQLNKDKFSGIYADRGPYPAESKQLAEALAKGGAQAVVAQGKKVSSMTEESRGVGTNQGEDGLDYYVLGPTGGKTAGSFGGKVTAIISQRNMPGVIMENYMSAGADYAESQPFVDVVAQGYCNGIAQFLDGGLCTNDGGKGGDLKVEDIPFGRVGLSPNEGTEKAPRSDFSLFISKWIKQLERIKEDERKKLLAEAEQKKQEELLAQADKATKEAQEANEAWLKDKSNAELAKKASDATKQASDALIAAEALRKYAKLLQMLSGETKDMCVKADLGLRPWLNARRLKQRGEDTREDGSPGEKVNRYSRLYVCSGSDGKLKWRVATEGNDNTAGDANENSMERILRLHADSESSPNYPKPHYPFDELEHKLVTLNGQEPDDIRASLSPYIEAAKAGKAEVTSLLSKASNARDRDGQKAGALMTAAQQPGVSEVIPLAEYVNRIKEDCSGTCPDEIVGIKHIYDQSEVNIPEFKDNPDWNCIANSIDSVENSVCGPTSLAMIAEAFNGVDENFQTANNLSRLFLTNKIMNCKVGTIDEDVESYAILRGTSTTQSEFHLNMQELVTGSDSFEKMEDWFRKTGYPIWARVKFGKKTPHYVAIAGISDQYVFIADPYYPGGDNIFKFKKDEFKRDYYNGKFWKVTNP